MTPQEILDTVWLKLSEQGRPSLKRTRGHDFVCAYRGDNGTRCAAGWLISDDKYDPMMEGRSVHGLVHDYTFPDWLIKNRGLIEALQHAHDLNGDAPEVGHATWNKRFQNAVAQVASEFALKLPPNFPTA